MMEDDGHAATQELSRFCMALKRLQMHSGLSVDTLAQRIGLSRSQLYSVLKGEVLRPPDWSRIVLPVVRECTDHDRAEIAHWREAHDRLITVDLRFRLSPAVAVNQRSKNNSTGENPSVIDKALKVKSSLNEAFEYGRSLSRRLSVVRLLRRSLNINDNYFPNQMSGPDGSPVDAVGFLINVDAGRICITGPSGAGKTAIVRRYICDSTMRNMTCFYVPLRDLINDSTDTADPVDLVKVLQSSVAAYGLDSAKLAQLYDQINQRRGIFVFDGFDELRFDPLLGIRVADAVESFFSAPNAHSTVVITTRSDEDLHGRFASYDFYQVLPLKAAQLGEFARAIGLTEAYNKLSFTTLNSGSSFELRPVMVLFALLGVDESANQPASAQTRFEVFERALQRILREDRPVPPAAFPKDLTSEEIRAIRFELLELMVRNWSISDQPVRLPEITIKSYLAKALSTVLGERNLTTAVVRYVVPTGICLELQDHGEISYGFAHNSIQEFLYARILLRCIREQDLTECRGLMSRDYYSAEILSLLGESISTREVSTLLHWSADSQESRMLRKVSIGILGFVRGPATTVLVARRLRAALDAENDIGVAGRIAETLRRLGDLEAISYYIGKLPDYPERAVHSDDLGRPLTFEIDEAIDGLEEHGAVLAQQLQNPHPLVRKHVLIQMIRGQLLSINDIIRLCMREAHEAELAHDEGGRLENLRTLRYAVLALRRFGTSPEADLVQDLLWRLGRHSWVHRVVLDDLQIVHDELQVASKGSPAVHANLMQGASLYLVRHGESDGNRDGRLLGSQIGGSLTARGQTQARSLAIALREQMPTGVRVISSPMMRAQQTARILADNFDCRGSISLNAGLTELDYGDWTGHIKGEIRSDCPDQYQQWVADPWENSPPKGEYMYEVYTRVSHALCEEFQEVADEYSLLGRSMIDEPCAIVIVSHYFPLLAAMKGLTRSAFETGPINCAITKLESTQGQWRVRTLNDTRHLGASGFEIVQL
jgi:broad specificity phosphatase PhoE